VRIASLLLACPQHLSAEQILASLRASGTRVSKATVYNTLNLFAERGLIRQLSDSNVDAPAMSDHRSTQDRHLHYSLYLFGRSINKYCPADAKCA
jgi:Fur family iron response transcriptional regulator